VSIPDLHDLGTILGVWAHPDDEAFLSAGLMARARQAGQRVAVLTATRGELGTSDPIAWPPERMGRRREFELTRSLAALGVEEHRFLGYSDGRCSSVPGDEGASAVEDAIAAIEPDTILTFGPDGYTGHTDHRAMSAWVDHAVRSTGSSARVLHATASPGFLVEFEEIHRRFDVFFAGEPSATAVDEMAVQLALDGELLDRKVAALSAQPSQTAGLMTDMGLAEFRRWVSTESFLDATPSVWLRGLSERDRVA
jgi:LmbE family N-acetylglucosaminyl deacetylase